ncbi:TPA: hypothetical protein I9Y37_001901 [Citrobacter freundii]|nr:hypothetical protein [Citrobacter freundii]HAT3963877.1 hypothetical protein [Citrobacter freundii]
MSKTIFLVNVDPFAHREITEPVDSFVFERELVEETDDAYIAKTPVNSRYTATYLRRDYEAFDTRDEALLHLERIVLNKMQELEDELSKWQQFNRSIEEEIMKP